MIEYRVSADNPHGHVFNVLLSIERPKAQGQKLSLPNWIPGSYFIRDFAKHVVMIEPFSGKNAVDIRKINSNTWECGACVGPLTVAYHVYAFDPSVRGAHLDGDHAFFNGCCLFLKVHDQENSPCHVKLFPPRCPQAAAWRVATTLTRDDAAPWGFGGYQAMSYQELIDHPVEMGQVDIQTFTVSGIDHHIVISGHHEGDLARLTSDVSKVCQAHMNMFGSPAPFKTYLFLLNIVKEGYGGLEHTSSSALIIQRDALPIMGETSRSRGYLNLLGLFSHEYFHAWNVKSIKPECFVSPDLNEKTYTEQLWAFEGITSYYDELALVRANIVDIPQYLDLLSETATKYLRTSGRKFQSVTQASFDTWIKFYQPNENSNNATVSYYIKGALIALIIDILLRTRTHHNLDNLMQQLWQQFGITKKGVPEGYIENWMEDSHPGVFHGLLQEILYSTLDLPLKEILESIGLEVHLRVAYGAEDVGGRKNPPVGQNGAGSGAWGCTMVKNQQKLMISSVQSLGAAEQAGLCAQDEIIAINEYRIDPDSFEKIAKRLKPGQIIEVTLSRQDIIKRVSMTLQSRPKDTVEIRLPEKRNEVNITKIEQWLGSKI